MARQGLAHGALALLLVCSLLYLHAAETTGSKGVALYLAAAWAFICGLALSHIIHEWGHFLGAVTSRSTLTIKPRVHPLFFDFDYLANRPSQFLALSLGGLLGTLFPYRSIDLETTGYAAQGDAAVRAAAVDRIRRWWREARQADW